MLSSSSSSDSSSSSSSSGSNSNNSDNNKSTFLNKIKDYTRLLYKKDDDSTISGGSTTTSSASSFVDKYKTLGIPEGRSDRCVSVDRQGMPEFTLNLGVMSIGDPLRLATTNVKLILDLDPIAGKRWLLDSISSSSSSSSSNGNSMEHYYSDNQGQVDQEGFGVLSRALRGNAISNVTKLQDGRLYYLLEEEDKNAIGKVAAEVIASTLHARLTEKGVQLDGVSHKQVILSSLVSEMNDKEKNTTTSSSSGSGSSSSSFSSSSNTRAVDQMVVDLEIRGHYSPPPDIDFDHIIEESINSEKRNIRRELMSYNTNCQNQRTKVLDFGLSQYDFREVNSWKGVRPNRGKGSDSSLPDNSAYRMACSEGINIPEYLDPSLEDMNIIVFGAGHLNEESSDGVQWIMVTVIPLMGILFLVIGCIVFKKRSTSHSSEGIAIICPVENDVFPEDITENWDKDVEMKEKIQELTQDTPPNDAGMESKQHVGLVGSMLGAFRHELGNMLLALQSEQRRASQVHSNSTVPGNEPCFDQKLSHTDKSLGSDLSFSSQGSKSASSRPLDPTSHRARMCDTKRSRQPTGYKNKNNRIKSGSGSTLALPDKLAFENMSSMSHTEMKKKSLDCSVLS